MRFKLRHRRRRKEENSVVDLESQELRVRKALTLGSWKSVSETGKASEATEEQITSARGRARSVTRN